MPMPKHFNDFMEKLSFGGQEISGNVGKYGETQAQICPYSQQTLKVWLRARANLQLANHTLIGQIEAPKQLLARLARICPILVWGRADRPCQVELNALEKEGGEPPSVSSQKNWSFRSIYQLDNILEYQNEISLQTTKFAHWLLGMEEHKGMKEGHWEMQTHPGLITLSLAEILSLSHFLVLRLAKCY